MSRSTEPGVVGAHDALIVMAKEPRPGFSKTRLAADVGQERAAALADAFARDTLELAARGPWSARVAFAPSDAGAWFEAAAPDTLRAPQIGDGLGERLAAAFTAAFEAGARRCLAIGTDCPQLEPSRIAAAFQALHDAEVCLGPAADGGYYLIGLGSLRSEPFDGIPWSTADVLRVTQERCQAAGLGVALLPEEMDVDDGAGLAELRRVLDGRPGVAPRTRALLLRG